jgi:tRNA(Arg) A34 adenosine deaminase TadA
LQIAIKLAETSEENMQHGSLIVLGGSLLAMGINKNTLNPFYHKDASKLSIHAEEAALKRCKRTDGAVLYVARINKCGIPRMSRPCFNCMQLIRAAGIKKIVYTINTMEEV